MLTDPASREAKNHRSNQQLVFLSFFLFFFLFFFFFSGRQIHTRFSPATTDYRRGRSTELRTALTY